MPSESPKDSPTSDADASTGLPEPPGDELVDLPSGSDLSPEMARAITAASLTRLVLLAGEAASGKTTLLSAIYEKFSEGEFADLLFAGSVTLVGWEKRCHLSRVASNADKADTERTLGLEQRLLHLRVRDKSLEAPAQDLLFTDLSGEVFRLIRDSTAECQHLGMLKRADHFVLLLDGEKLASSASRHEAHNNGMALLRSCVDAGMVASHSFVDVVFSKYDLMEGAGRDTTSFLTHIVETTRSRFGGRLGRLRFHKVAARPALGTVEPAFGVNGLLRAWVDDSPYLSERGVVARRFSPGASMFDRYLGVRFPEINEMQVWTQEST